MKDDAVTISKGIAIILMVVGHSKCPLLLDRFIYMFHMPLFFVMSGYCFKEYYLQNWSNRGEYIKKRLKKLWWPYVKYSLIFIVLHNFFFDIGLYNETFSWKGQELYVYHLNDYLTKIPRAIMMKETELLLGGYWFLTALFHGSIIFFILRLIFQPQISFLLVLLITPLSYAFFYDTAKGPTFCLDMLSVLFISTGDVLCKRKILNYLSNNKWVLIICCFFIVFIGSLLTPASLLTIKDANLILPYYSFAVCGTIMIFYVSKSIPSSMGRLKNLLLIAGNNSLTILTWHFLCFKLVNLIIIYIYNLPIDNLAQFPRIAEYASKGWWLLYVICGVCIPLIFVWFNNKIKVYLNERKDNRIS